MRNVHLWCAAMADLPGGRCPKNGPGRIASDERAGMDTPVWKEKGL